MLVVALLLTALIGLGVCALVAVTFWRAGQWGVAAAAVLVALAGWGALRSVDPDPEFYTSVFERETGLTFPASGKVVSRAATHPNSAGEYCTAAVVAIAPRDAERLRAALHRAEATLASGPSVHCDDEDGVVDARGPYLVTSRQYKDGRSIRWGVSEDGHTLAFRYVEL